jgi:exonuclease SbcC
MRLISIDIKNFRVIKNAHIEFPDAVIGIIGRNGAGKSSIIESISWALYGNQAARTGKTEIKSIFASNDDECRVELTFVVNDEKYRVVRRLIGKSNRAEVELYRGDASESVGVNETKAYVGQLLGLDWKSFLSSFLARQAELNALSDLQPSRRRDHIAGMLGIEKLDKAILKIKEESRLNKDKTSFLQTQLSQKEIVEEQVVELEKTIDELNGPIDLKHEQVENKKKNYNQSKSELDKINKQRVDYIKLESQLKAEGKTFELLQQHLESNNAEFEELKQINIEYQQLLPQQSKYDEVNRNYSEQLKLKSQYELNEQLNKQLSELISSKKKLSDTIYENNNKTNELTKLINKIPSDVEQNLIDIKDELQSSRENYIRLDSEHKQLNIEKKRLNDQLNNIKDMKSDSVCDHCLRPFGDDYEKIKGHFKEDLKRLAEKGQQKSNELLALKSAGGKLKQKEEELNKLVNQLSHYKNEYEKLEDRKTQFEAQLKDIELDIIKINNDILKTKADSFDLKEFNKLVNLKSQLEKDVSKINQLKGRLEQIPKLEKSISATKTKIDSVRVKTKSVQDKINKLNFDESVFNSVVKAYEKEQLSLEEFKNELSMLIKEQDVSKASLDGKKELIAQFEKSEKELDDTISNLYYSEKLNQLLGQYRQELIASIRPSLATISTRLFKEMTDNKYSLVELDEQYNLRVMDGGDFYDIDRFSGGEKDLANLCLRLAISLALTESAGLDHSFVILDEVFGSQDNERKELILKSLARLKIQFPQILLITHIDDIKDGVEKIIEVLPTGNGYSEVIVV